MTRRSQKQAGISDDEERCTKRQKVEEVEPVVPASAAELDAAEYETTSSEASGSDVAEPLPREPFEPRHPDLWWHDGNVVVAAKGMSFKVHASILERFSDVFKEMLSVTGKGGYEEDGGGDGEDESEGEDDERPETFQGCRVLRVEDLGEDLGALFDVLYNGGAGGFFNWNKPLRFEYLRQVTTLAVKYEIQHIIDEAVARLNYVFPSTFEPSRLQQHSYHDERLGHPVLFSQARHCLDAVVLARKINANSPPPFIVMALYHCLALNMASLYRPTEGDDADHFLSFDDYLTCGLARSRLVSAAAVVRAPALYVTKNPACVTAAACRGVMGLLVRSWVHHGIFSDYAVLDSIAGALQAHAERHPQHRLCNACSATLVQSIDARRRDFFAELGGIFGVANWPAAQLRPEPAMQSVGWFAVG